MCLCTSLLKKVLLLMVAMYCNQGDNTGDAISFVSQLVRILVPEEKTPSECSFVFGCGVVELASPGSVGLLNMCY